MSTKQEYRIELASQTLVIFPLNPIWLAPRFQMFALPMSLPPVSKEPIVFCCVCNYSFLAEIENRKIKIRGSGVAAPIDGFSSLLRIYD